MDDQNKNTGHGLIPDYPIPASIENVLSGNEAIWEFVYDLVQKKK